MSSKNSLKKLWTPLSKSSTRCFSCSARAGLPAQDQTESTSYRPKTYFSGIQPSGTVHLGNLLGALSPWVDLQNSAHPSDSIFYSIVGLHAITIPKDPTTLRRERREMLASLLACGINPERSCLYHQDQVPQHAELAWLLTCLTPMGRLKQMTTWKSKLAVSRNASSEDEVDESMLGLGLFSYPVLQAADVLLYKATHVPVGEDQAQHLELCRQMGQIFNKAYGKGTFPIPEVLIVPSKRILSLKNPSEKMSKSSPAIGSRILITDTAAEIRSKFKKAMSDSLGPPSFDPVNRPGISNLLLIYAACEGLNRTPEQVAEDFKNTNDTAAFKNAVGEIVEAKIGPIRSEFAKLKDEAGYLEEIGNKGRLRAMERAESVLVEVREKMGLGRY